MPQEYREKHTYTSKRTGKTYNIVLCRPINAIIQDILTDANGGNPPELSKREVAQPKELTRQG